MERLVTAAEMAEIDRKAQEQGIPGMVLMENAGQHAFRIWLRLALEELAPEHGEAELSHVDIVPWDLGPVVAAAGAGNNGGDALVMARACSNLGIPVTAVLSKRELKGSAEEQHKILKSMGVELRYWDEPEAREAILRASWIFDGVTGTGISGELRGSSGEMVEAINESLALVLAVDVPSGVGDEYEPGFLAADAAATVTMGLKKRALYLPGARELAGRIEVGDPGFPRALLTHSSGRYLATAEDLEELYPEVSDAAHKGTRGFLGLFSGGEGTSGAAVLAGRGALHAGCGLVRINTDPGSRAEIAGGDPALMVSGLDIPAFLAGPEEGGDLLSRLNPLLARYSALAVGPGWGVAPERRQLLLALPETRLPGVLDADGLNNLAAGDSSGDYQEPGKGDPLSGVREGLFGSWVFTPHPGEAARLLGRSTAEVLADPPGAAAEISRRFGATVLLKGAVSVVVSPEGEQWFVEGMNPALATAGSGDVLTGVVGALLARGASPKDAAVGGALLHQEAGELLFQEAGWFAASALPEAIGRVAGSLFF